MSDLEEEYRLDYFAEHGFQRRECGSCGDHFWTRDGTRETCGEPPCEQYSFIDEPGFGAELTLSETREAFLSFFGERGHERVEPYPVAANRWRDDVLLTQASIYDFQPHVTSGRSPPPGNPLAVSQPCIRMQDIDNVGKTGRHTMAFEMMGHHAFNAEEGAGYAYEGEVYWKEECVEYCVGLLEELGADTEEVTFIEDPWVGGGNAGPAFEVIYKGLELATLVFMQFEEDPEGDYEMKDGNSYSRMDRRVIDTGYGLERWTWMSQGTPTVYEAVYPEMLDFLRGTPASSTPRRRSNSSTTPPGSPGSWTSTMSTTWRPLAGNSPTNSASMSTGCASSSSPWSGFMPSPTTPGRSRTCWVTGLSPRTSGRATSRGW